MPDHDRRIRTVEAMVRLRQKFEPQSHIVRAPRDLWSTPEYLVYSVLRGIALQHDGMTELDALRRVDERRGFNQLLGFETPSTEEYLARLLHKTAPRYLWLGPKPLTEAIAVARNGLGKPPEPVWTGPMGPPPNWGWYKIPHESGREMFPVLGRELPLVPRSVCDEELIDLGSMYLT